MTTTFINAYCFVPGCPNTQRSTPNKLFFTVPKSKTRDKWCKVVRRDPLSLVTTRCCCEDHFTLEEDVRDWMRYKILKEAGQDLFRLKLKDDVVPHIFDCQPDRKASHSTPVRSAVTKRQATGIISALVQSAPVPSTGDPLTLEVEPQTDPSTLAVESRTTSNPGLELDGSNEVEQSVFSNSTLDQTNLSAIIADSSLIQSDSTAMSSVCDASVSTTNSVDFGCQASMKKRYRSKNVQVAPSMKPMAVQTDEACRCFLKDDIHETDEDESAVNVSHSSDVYNLNSSVLDAGCFDNEEEWSDEEEAASSLRNSIHLQSTVSLITNDPKMFIGVDATNMVLISALQTFTRLSQLDVFIALRKLRLNECNSLLASYFSRSESSISRSIQKSFPLIAGFLETLIVWSDRKTIQANVPLTFRARYSKVESIIDCFEIQIEKPSDALEQSLTWSSYKDCNTVKYLVSSTPDGVINYISKGFTGRATDLEIVKQSGYLNVLKEGTCVMADRGFKQIESILVKKNCTFVRPPSVSSGCKQAKEEIKRSKAMSSLRIHIERVIRRIREYKFLGPHACFNHHLLNIVDYAAIMACALSNLQGPLIK